MINKHLIRAQKLTKRVNLALVSIVILLDDSAVSAE